MRELDFKQRYIWPLKIGEDDSFSSVCSFRHDLEFRLSFQQQPQSTPDDGLVIREQNADRRGSIAHWHDISIISTLGGRA
jgi:hypothetical protein